MAKTAAATALLSLAGWAVLVLLRDLPPGRAFVVLKLLAVMAVGCAVYVIAAKLLRIEMLSLVSGGKRRAAEQTNGD